MIKTSSSYTKYSTIVAGEEVEHKWKERYEITCPHCKHGMQAAPSLFQRAGDSKLGYGHCPECGTGMRIIHNTKTNTMKAEDINNDI